MKKTRKEKLLLFCVVLFLEFIIFYSGIQIVEGVFFQNKDPIRSVTKKTVVRDGIEYFPRHAGSSWGVYRDYIRAS